MYDDDDPEIKVAGDYSYTASARLHDGTNEANSLTAQEEDENHWRRAVQGELRTTWSSFASGLVGVVVVADDDPAGQQRRDGGLDAQVKHQRCRSAHG